MRLSAFVLCFAAWFTLAEEAPPSFETPKAREAQKTFQKTEERLKAEYESKLNKARKEYLKALESTLKSLKKKPESGEAALLTSTIEGLKKEIDRWEKKTRVKPPEKGPDGITFEGGDGESMEDAVVIKGAGDSVGAVDAESFWLKAHFPKFKKVRQALLGRGEKNFDMIELEGEGGQKKKVYFDITECIGFPK